MNRARALALLLVFLVPAVLLADGEWKETGSAVRKKKIGFISVSVYEITHSMKELPKTKSKQAVIDAEVDKKLVWTMKRDVENEKIQNALKEAFELNGYKDAKKIEAFCAAFKAELKEDSKVTIAYDAAKKETTVTVESGSGSAKVEGVEFMKAVWSLWFGKIDQETLGDDLLAKWK